MKTLISVGLIWAASPVLAHPSHITEASGHNHWLALGIVVLAAGAAVWRPKKETTPQEA